MMYQSIKNHDFPPDPFNLGVSLNGGTPPHFTHPKRIILVGKNPWVCWVVPPFVGRLFPPFWIHRFPPNKSPPGHRISCSFFEASNPARQQGLKKRFGTEGFTATCSFHGITRPGGMDPFYHEFIACYIFCGIIKSKD